MKDTAFLLELLDSHPLFWEVMGRPVPSRLATFFSGEAPLCLHLKTPALDQQKF